MKTQKKHHILYVITQGHWGGAQRYVFDLASELCRDHNVTVAIGSSSPNDLAARLSRAQHLKGIETLRRLVRPISPIQDMLAIFEIRRLIMKLSPRIVHLNSSKSSILGSIASRLCPNRPIVIQTIHGWVSQERLPWYQKILYRSIEKIGAWLSDSTITLSPQDTGYGIGLNIPTRKIHCIPLGIDEDSDGETHPSPPHKKEVAVVCIANFYKTKGVDILLSAWKEVEQSHQRARLYLLGDGPERRNLEKHLSKLALSRVTLRGFDPHAAAFLSHCAVMVAPSRKEGLPYVILEACTRATPVIATDVGGVPSLIEHKKTGLLSPAEHPAALASHIIWALSYPHHMRTMARAAQAHVGRHHTTSRMITQTVALYQLLLQEDKGQ
jgi:glycosyltransferase involved in cell wall biosynthesis